MVPPLQLPTRPLRPGGIGLVLVSRAHTLHHTDTAGRPARSPRRDARTLVGQRRHSRATPSRSLCVVSTSNERSLRIRTGPHDYGPREWCVFFDAHMREHGTATPRPTQLQAAERHRAAGTAYFMGPARHSMKSHRASCARDQALLVRCAFVQHSELVMAYSSPVFPQAIWPVDARLTSYNHGSSHCSGKQEQLRAELQSWSKARLRHSARALQVVGSRRD